jgi:hypothetical protein
LANDRSGPRFASLTSERLAALLGLSIRSGNHADEQIAPRGCHRGKYSDLHSLGVEPRGQVLRTLFGFGSFQMQVPAEHGPGGLAADRPA